jgi:uncharacterized protein YjgD (DUF1641 family)
MSLGIDAETKRLSAPLPQEGALDRIEQRLDRLEQLLQKLDGSVARDRSLALDTRLETALGFVERLNAPATMQLLSDVADRSVELSQSMRFLDQVPGLIAALVDTFDGAAMRLGESGVDLHARAVAVGRLTERLTAAAATADATAPVGVWGLLRALSDPDIQRAVGFCLRLAKTFGAGIDARPAE